MGQKQGETESCDKATKPQPTPDGSHPCLVKWLGRLKSEIGSWGNWKELNEMVIKEGDFREGAAFFFFVPPSSSFAEMEGIKRRAVYLGGREVFIRKSNLKTKVGRQGKCWYPQGWVCLTRSLSSCPLGS